MMTRLKASASGALDLLEGMCMSGLTSFKHNGAREGT